ncbi:ABC transporter substrate-binding protein [Cupriavidus plantarum]|uniref:Sulfonate transport system substrate-binding protein n=1 Tax=Cupriavidus plantarum TaxID=942865 RepID=A0A316ES18_9BURK|nr:ABC transporter substrate-binding protein [Cupriavidus plantarum]NYI00356.1 sulfonate transport system substrate-binding protein [Cupriavidus plantarum]PWK34766.1 sulfonate transport system substrate-binding protein [Cupriavidus plantarum]REE93209.1 sulfonate transport system substrate-binding protein [Cupriavidus plantarum]
MSDRNDLPYASHPPHADTQVDPARRRALRTIGRHGLGTAATLASLSALTPFSAFSAPSASARPEVIRIGVAQPATGTPPTFAGSSLSIAHAKGWVEEAFKPAGTRIEWYFFKGAGPAVNEALTNRQLDFALQGDLPAIVARAAGLKTRLVLATGVRTNIYIGVPPDSPLKTVADLRGKRVSLFKGTNMHLPALRLLESQGLTEKDVRLLNLDTAGYLAALTTRDIDAAIGAMDILRLRDKGAVRVLYTSKGQSPIYTRQSHVLVTEDFLNRYPEATQQFVRTAVESARWASDEKNREEVLRTWARAGTPYEHWKEDFDGEPLRVRLNPNFDPFLVARYKDAVEQAYRFRLSRARFDVDQWIDQRYLRTALEDLKLQTYWPIYQPDGKILGA